MKFRLGKTLYSLQATLILSDGTEKVIQRELTRLELVTWIYTYLDHASVCTFTITKRPQV